MPPQLQAIIAANGWAYTARPAQIAPPVDALPTGPWRWWVKCAGRGAGKTRSGGEWINEIASSGKAKNIALVAKTPSDARKVMIEHHTSGILACARRAGQREPEYSPSNRTVTWANGAVATTYSMEKPSQLRGPEHDAFWWDEAAAGAYPQETLEQLDLGLRVPWSDGTGARGLITTTPRATPFMKAILSAPDTVVVRGTTFDNADNLDPKTLASFRRVYEGTRVGRQELYAEVLDDVAGALWTQALIDSHRAADYPDLPSCVVAIDPAVTSGASSSETGIIVFGGGVDGQGYVLEDLSCRLSPNGWAERAVQAFWDWKADSIVAETNNGGDLVTNTIKAIDPRVKVRGVRATRGKYTRAEPVAALMEQGKIHHVGQFPELEKQMVNFTGAAGDVSPDRLDAMVWAATAVMLDDITSLAVGFA